MLRYVDIANSKGTNLKSISISPCKEYQIIILDQLYLFKNGEQIAVIQDIATDGIVGWSLDHFVVCSEKLLVFDLKGKLVSSQPLQHNDPIQVLIYNDWIIVVYHDGIVQLVQFINDQLIPLCLLSFQAYYTTIHSCTIIDQSIVIFGKEKVHLWTIGTVSPFFSCELAGVVLQPTPFQSSIHHHLYQRIVHWMGYSVKRIECSCFHPTRRIVGHLTPTSISFYQYPQLDLVEHLMIQDLLIPNQLENESVEHLCFWNSKEFALITSHGRLGIGLIDNPKRVQFTILPLEFPFSSFSQYGQFWFLHGNDSQRQISSCIYVEEEEWIDYLVSENLYSEALEFCTRVGLDTDMVYKHQWELQVSIQVLDLHILEMVKDKEWVFKQCKTVFSSTLNTRSLLQYGLRLTDRATKADVDAEIERVLEDELSPVKEANWPSTMDIFFYRVDFVQMLEKLDTFEAVYEKEILMSRTNGFNVALEFGRFVEKDFVEIAGELASNGRFHGLQVLFTRHGDEVLPYRLSLLDLIPPTISPNEFSHILPRVKDQGVLGWDITQRCNVDWTQTKSLLEFVDMFREKEQKPTLMTKYNFPESMEQVKKWYFSRIDFLDDELGLTKMAGRLCTLANENGISDMNHLELKLQILDQIRGSSQDYTTIRWTDVLALPAPKLVPLLLKSADPNDNRALFKIIFVIKLAQVDWTFFLDSLIQFCTQQGGWILTFIRELKTEDVQGIDLYYFVDKCAYQDVAQDLRLWQEILLLLKMQSIHIDNSDGWGGDDFDEVDSLTTEASKWDDLEKHIQLASLFERHGLSLNLKGAKELQKEKGLLVLSKLIRQSSILQTDDNQEWKDAMRELTQVFSSGYFKDIEKADIVSEMLSFALSRGQFQFAQSILYPTDGNSNLEKSVIEKIVLNAAVELFDNDQEGDKNRGLLKQSLVCCTIVKPTDVIRQHMDLIEATHDLCQVYHVETESGPLMPIQIRLSPDRMNFIELLLKQSPDLIYKPSVVERLAEKLFGVSSKQLKLRVDLSLADAAHFTGDFTEAIRICEKLIETSGWLPKSSPLRAPIANLFQRLAKESLLLDEHAKLILYGNAIRFASPAELDNIVANSRKQIIEEETNLVFSDLGIENFILEDINSYGEVFESLIGDVENNTANTKIDFYQKVGSSLAPNRVMNLGLFETYTEYLMATNKLEKLEDVYFQLGKSLLSSDPLIAHTYLIQSRKDAKDFVDLINSSEFYDQNPTLAAYLFATQIALKVVQTSCEAPWIADWSVYGIQEFCNIMNEFLESSDAEMSVDSIDFIKEFKSYFGIQPSEANHLLKEALGESLDIERFEKDLQYRKDAIFMAVETLKEEEFTTAIQLGKDHGILEWEMVGHHLLWLFSSNFDVSVVRQRYDKIADMVSTNIKSIVEWFTTMYNQLLSQNDLYCFFVEIILQSKELLCLENENVNQFKYRLHCFQVWKQDKTDQLYTFKEILGFKKQKQMYIDLWTEHGPQLGISKFMEYLKTLWDIVPIVYFEWEKDFIPDAPCSLSQLSAEIIVNYCMQSKLQEMDGFTKVTFLDSLIPVMRDLDHSDLESVMQKLIIGELSIHFDVDSRTHLLDELLEKLPDTSTLAQRVKTHLELLNVLISLEDPNTNEKIPSSLINSIDCNSENPTLLKRALFTAVSTNLSPWLIHQVTILLNQFWHVKLNLEDLYRNVVVTYLNTANISNIELLCDSLDGCLDRFKLESTDGWESEDLFDEGSDVRTAVNLAKQSILEALRSFVQNSKGDSHLKLLVLKLLENKLMVTNDEQLKSTKLKSMIKSIWNIDMEIYGPDFTHEETFDLLIQTSSTKDQYLDLFGILLEWNDSLLLEKFLTFLCKPQHRDIAIPLFCLFSKKYSSEYLTKTVQELEDTKSLTEFYFLFGLFSNSTEVQAKVLDDFCKVSPNKNAYCLTYAVIIALGLYHSLSENHQAEAYEAIFSFRKHSVILFATLLGSPQSSHINLLKMRYKISTFTYRRFVTCQIAILEQALLIWSSSESSSNEADQFCKVKTYLLDSNHEEIFELIVNKALAITNTRELLQSRLSHLYQIASK